MLRDGLDGRDAPDDVRHVAARRIGAGTMTGRNDPSEKDL
jgi:hypothetical protein